MRTIKVKSNGNTILVFAVEENAEVELHETVITKTTIDRSIIKTCWESNNILFFKASNLDDFGKIINYATELMPGRFKISQKDYCIFVKLNDNEAFVDDTIVTKLETYKNI